MKRIVVAATLVACSLSQPCAAKYWDVRKVEIDGETFRVGVFAGSEVRVSSTKIVGPFGRNQTPQRMERMKRAVKEATGCELIDDFWGEVARQGKLACPPEGIKAKYSK